MQFSGSHDIRFEQAHVFDAYTCVGASAITDAATSTSTMHTALDLPLTALVANRPLLQAMLLLLFEHTLRTCIFCEPELPLEACSQAQALTDHATRDASNSVTPRNTSWSWLASFTARCQRQLCQVSESLDNFQVRDPWRTPRAHQEQWKPQYVNQEPTLPLPKPEGPEPVYPRDLSPVAVWPHPLRSGSMRQCGLALVPLVCVDVQRTLFVDCSVGVNVNEGFTYAGIWEQTGFREIHMAYTGLLSQVSLFWSTGGQGSPTVMSLRTHSLEQVVFNLGLQHWSLGAVETMLQGLGTLFRCQGLFFFSMLTAMP